MTTTTDATMTAAMNDILGGDLGSELAGIFERMEWAEDEIARAMRANPARADVLWHSFRVMTPQHELMSTEIVYRAHVREQIARVIAGQDTRPGTAAEACCVLSDASQVAPLTETAAGLYARMWAAAGLPGEQWALRTEHYEALHGSRIDQLERETRRKMTVKDRTPGTTCQGMHHGEPVTCSLAVQAQGALFPAA